EALREVAEERVGAGEVLRRVVRRLGGGVGPGGGGILLVPADRGEGGAADRAGAAVGHLGGQLRAHPVDAGGAYPQRFLLRRQELLPGGEVRRAQAGPLGVLRREGGGVAGHTAGVA